MNLGFDQNWFAWGLGLIVIFPVLVILIGETIHHLEKSYTPLAMEWAAVFRFLQRFVMPQLVLLLIMTRILELPVDNVFVKIVETLLWIFIIHFSMTLVNLVLFSDSGKSSWQIKAPKLLLDFARAVVVLIGGAIVLSYVWGFELGKMLAALGVGSIVLGLALQDTLSSLLSGFALIASRQFKEGDWLEIGEHIGKVIHINWRSVTLLNRDEDIIILPNSDLANGKFVNFSNPYPRHVESIFFDFSFDDAPYKVKEILIEAALKTEGILSDPLPQVFLISYDEFTIRHQIRFHIAHYTNLPQIRDRFVSSIWYAAERGGITFPTRSHEVTLMKPAPEAEPEYKRFLALFLDSSLFRGRDKKILTDMAKQAASLHYGSHEFIIQQGDDSDCFFMLINGSAKEVYTDVAGNEHDIANLEPGEFFGLVSLVKNEADRTSIIATSDAEVIEIDETQAHRLFENDPRLSTFIEQKIENGNHELDAIEAKLVD